MTNDFNVTLAHPKSDKKTDFTSKTFIQPKLDGVRCYITKDGAFTRNHKPLFTVDHIKAKLAPFFVDYPNIILDGELYNHSLKKDFEKIISLVKKTKPTQADIQEAAKMVQFHNYDLFSGYAPEALFEHRTGLIEVIHNHYNLSSTVGVPTFEVSSDEEASAMYDDFMNLGYEGAMLRKNTPYTQKRSHDLQKMKKFHDTEGVITHVVEGKGKLQGAVGKFTVELDGVPFGCPMSANTHDQRRAAWADKDNYIGKTVTFTYFRINPTGVPYLPIYKGLRDASNGTDL